MKRFMWFALAIVAVCGLIVSLILYKGVNPAGSEDGNRNAAKSRVNVHFIHWVDFPREIFSRFSQKHPNLNVVYERFTEDYYPTIQRVRMASGEELDVMGIMEKDYKDYVYRGFLVDLSEEPYMNNYRDDTRNAVKRLHTAGKEFAVAYHSSVFGIWYNKILFNKYNLEVPRNYREFLEVCRILKLRNVHPLVLGARDPKSAGYLYLLRFPGMTAGNGHWVEQLNQGKVEWTAPEIQSAMGDIQYLVSSGYISKDSIHLTYHQAFTEFTKGHAAMTLMEDRSLNLVRGETEKVCDPGVFPIPLNNRGITQKTAGSRTRCLTGIFSESKHLKEADSLMEYLSSAETAQMYCDMILTIPNIKGLDTGRIKFNEAWEPLRELEYIPSGIEELEPEVRECLEKSARQLLTGSKSSMQVIRELQTIQERAG